MKSNSFLSSLLWGFIIYFLVFIGVSVAYSAVYIIFAHDYILINNICGFLGPFLIVIIGHVFVFLICFLLAKNKATFMSWQSWLIVLFYILWGIFLSQLIFRYQYLTNKVYFIYFVTLLVNSTLAYYFGRRLYFKKQAKRLNFLNSFNISEREKELITCIQQGLSNEEIAKKLYITLGTVKNHLKSIYRKLDVKNRVQLYHKIKQSEK